MYTVTSRKCTNSVLSVSGGDGLGSGHSETARSGNMFVESLSLFYYFITLSILIMEWVLFDLTVILAASLKCYIYDNAPIYL